MHARLFVMVKRRAKVLIFCDGEQTGERGRESGVTRVLEK